MKPRMVEHSPRKRTAATERSAVPGRRTSHQSPASRPRPQSANAWEEPALLLLERFPGPDRARISFTCYAPGAKEVLLAGSFNDWQPRATPLSNQADGRWTVELELCRGRHEYRFLVDGSWADDPLAPAFVPNPFGTLNCLLLVG